MNFIFDRFQMEQSYHALVKCISFGVLGHIKSRSDRINFNKWHCTWSGRFNWQQCSCRNWLVNHQLGNRLLHANRLIVKEILCFSPEKELLKCITIECASRLWISKRFSRRHSLLFCSCQFQSTANPFAKICKTDDTITTFVASINVCFLCASRFCCGFRRILAKQLAAFSYCHKSKLLAIKQIQHHSRYEQRKRICLHMAT